MSKGLDTLKEIKYKLSELEFVLEHNHREKAPYISETKWNTVEKELKASEIIKNKRVDINLLLNCPDSELYNEILEARDRPERFRLTQKEYKLLRDVLE